MATNPTRWIRASDHPSTFDHSADELLARLADMPAEYEVPYLTVTLDWSVAGGNPARRTAEETRRSEPDRDDAGSYRPALNEMEKDLKALIESHGPRGETYEALQQSADRITNWLQTELDPAASGVYIVSHEPTGVFEATGLNLPIDTSVNLDTVPRLYKLVRLVEDYPTYAILQADQENATLSFVTHGTRDRSVQLESSLYPRKQQSGGWSQKRYQKRADERIEAFSRDTMEAVDKALKDTGVDVLIMAGSEVMMSALHNAMPERLEDIVFETVRMESVVTPEQKIDQTIPLAEKAERQREQESVDRLKNAIGQGNIGAAGASEVVRTLQNGQVDSLVLCDTFAGNGWADYDMHVYGVGNLPTNHPAGGDMTKLVEVDLRDELVRLALSSGAEIDIIHSAMPVEDNGDVRDADDKFPKTQAATELEEMGGVGAILRYSMTGDAEPETI